MTELFEPEFTRDASQHRDCTRELKTGEVFLGNIRIDDGIRPELQSLKTIRIGEQAYDLNGKPIQRSYCRPLFLHQSEVKLYDIIMKRKQ